MKAFNQTIVICTLAALVIILLFGLSGNSFANGGFVMVLGAPILFVIGCIVAMIGSKGSDLRQVGLGIMLSALIYFVIGFATCSVGGTMSI